MEKYKILDGIQEENMKRNEEEICMHFAKQSKNKKTIAILLVIAMLLTIMPVTVFAEGEEGAVFGAELTYTSNTEDTTLFNLRADVTSGSHLITTPSLLQVKWVVNGTEEGFTTAGIQNEGDTAFYAQKELTVAGNTTVKAIFDYDGTQFESNEVTIEAEAKSVTVNSTMNQADIQAAIDANDEIVFAAGTYEDANYIIPEGQTKIIKTTNSEITRSDDKVVLVHPNGHEKSGAIELKPGAHLVIDTANITIESTGNGIFMGYNTTLDITGSEVHIDNSTYAGIYVTARTDGGIAKDYINIIDSIFTADKNGRDGIRAENEGSGQNPYRNNIDVLFQNSNVSLCSNTGTASGGGGKGYWMNFLAARQSSFTIDGGTVKMNNNASDGYCCYGRNVFTVKNGAYVEASNNGRFGLQNPRVYIKSGSELKANENGFSNISGYEFQVTEKSMVTANNAKKGDGIFSGETSKTMKVDADGTIENITHNILIDDSSVIANGNYQRGLVAGFRFSETNNWTIEDGSTSIVNSTVETSNNGLDGIHCEYGTLIDNSKVTANGNKKTADELTGIASGIVFANGTSGATVVTEGNVSEIKNGSNIETNNNDNGLSVVHTLKITDSVLFNLNNKINDIAHSGANSDVIVDGTTVGVLKDGEKEIYSADSEHGSYVISGSLQGIHDNMTGTYGDAWNTVKGVEEVYAAPINNEGTKLTRFDLHNEVNKEVGLQSEQAKWTNKSFTYYDPKGSTVKYDYQFRFNKDGEDLVEGESDNAYVWAPASVLHYDATEGTVDTLGTAGKITVGNSVTTQIGDNTGLNTRYTQDVTIYGNSLNLAEKTMPTAAREGYAFAGWFVADNEEEAAKYAEANNFTELYKLLNTEFTAASKVATNLNDVSTAQAEKTIYAKWTKGKVDGTIFEDGIRNDSLDDNESRFEGINVKLLKDGVQVATATTDANGYYKFVDVDFGNYTVEIEWPEKDNDAMDNICAVSNHEMGNKFTAGVDKAFAASQAVTISKDNLEATLNAGFYNTSGGGGWTPTDPGTDEPEIDIPDPDVPLTEPEVPEEPTIDIEDPDVPLAEVPGETVEIEEPEVPLGDAPATGDRSAAIPFAVLMLIAAAGLAITRKRFN